MCPRLFGNNSTGPYPLAFKCPPNKASGSGLWQSTAGPHHSAHCPSGRAGLGRSGEVPGRAKAQPLQSFCGVQHGECTLQRKGHAKEIQGGRNQAHPTPFQRLPVCLKAATAMSSSLGGKTRSNHCQNYLPPQDEFVSWPLNIWV